MVQFLIYDDHGDTPSVYVQAGVKLGPYYIVDNDVVCGTVIAYKPFDNPPPMDICKRMYKGEAIG